MSAALMSRFADFLDMLSAPHLVCIVSLLAGWMSGRMLDLLARVKAGATLYVSLDTGLPDGFEALTGLEPQTRERGRAPGDIAFEGIERLTSIPNRGTFRVIFREVTRDSP